MNDRELERQIRKAGAKPKENMTWLEFLGWIRWAYDLGVLNSIIGTEKVDNVQQLIGRYQHCTAQLLALFPHDPLGDSEAHYYIERLEALIEKKLLQPVTEDRISTIPQNTD